MGSYKDIVKEDTPRIIIKFKFDDQGREQYEWGNVGNIPVMTLIGAIIKTQVELSIMQIDRLGLYDKLCPEQMLVIAQGEDKNIYWFLHKDAPQHGMLGMLDMIRVTLVDSVRVRQAQQQQTVQQVQPIILDPTGQPIRR